MTGRYKRTTHWCRWLALGLCLLWQSPTLSAQTLTELEKLIAFDVGRGDIFGFSVALSGDRALIGAPQNTSYTGAAYVYERDGAGMWVEVAKLTASDARSGDYFGVSVSISGDRALVGASRDDDGADSTGILYNSGSVYVFERDETGVWLQVGKFTAPEPSRIGQFGGSVALSGNLALVGAISTSGAAHVYERSAAGVWSPVVELVASDATLYDRFGHSVALSGDRALVGACSSPPGGAAYLYERDATGVWFQVNRLSGSDTGFNDCFGYSVSILDDRALIGAGGSAYVFEHEGTGMWVEAAKLTHPDAAAGQQFGASVAIQDNKALVGAPNMDVVGTDSGAAYVYERDATGAWFQVSQLIASDSASEDYFGTSVALSGNHGLVGAYGNDWEDSLDIHGSTSGSAYLFGVAAGSDEDEDGIFTIVDNCPADWNPLQENLDADLLGDACDPDDDNDGVEDTYDTFPLDPDRSAPLLILDNVDSARYGFQFEGLDSHREALDRQFDASGSNLLLTLTGYDIDTADEVRVLVNGTRIGFLSRTPSDGQGTSQLIIPYSVLRDSMSNTLRFQPTNPGWRWGVTDLLLSAIGELPPLVLDTVDSAPYGFRFEGTNSHREALERHFDASGTDLLFTVTGYDIDTAAEVRVLVNGTQIGFLSRTPDNGRGTSQLTIAQSLLDDTGNTLRLEQVSPGWRWGVTDMVLSNGSL